MRRRAYAFLTLVVLMSGCSPSPKERPFVSGIHVDLGLEACASVADAYVKNTYHWEEATYRVENQGNNGAATVFYVINEEDKRLRRGVVGGGGKSFAMYVDCSNQTVMKTLRFQ